MINRVGDGKVVEVNELRREEDRARPHRGTLTGLQLLTERCRSGRCREQQTCQAVRAEECLKTAAAIQPTLA